MDMAISERDRLAQILINKGVDLSGFFSDEELKKYMLLSKGEKSDIPLTTSQDTSAIDTSQQLTNYLEALQKQQVKILPQ